MSVYFIQTCHNHRGADVRLSILHFIKWDDDEMSPTILNTPTINIKNWTGISCEQMQKITTSCTCTCSMPAVNVIISVSIEWSKTKTIFSSHDHETHLHHSSTSPCRSNTSHHDSNFQVFSTSWRRDAKSRIILCLQHILWPGWLRFWINTQIFTIMFMNCKLKTKINHTHLHFHPQADLDPKWYLMFGHT